jgi:Ni/Co efflux regulator RcnB
MKSICGALALVLVVATPVTIGAQHGKNGEKHGNKHGHQRDADDVGDRGYFQEQDVRIIREYYEPRYRSLPPGLAKKYRRTGQLPPGWQKKMQPLPIEVERRLVVLPPEYRRGYIDGTVVVYSPHTQVIVDVVALFGR